MSHINEHFARYEQTERLAQAQRLRRGHQLALAGGSPVAPSAPPSRPAWSSPDRCEPGGRRVQHTAPRRNLQHR